MADLLLREVVVEGRLVDVRASDGVVTSVGPRLTARPGETAIDGRRGALVPGLHDHHIHLLALAAAERSVTVSPAATPDPAAFAAALAAAHRSLPPEAWLRVVGYHESIAGPLDRWRLDDIVRDRPVRVQHRTGVEWVLNSRAVEVTGLDVADPTPATGTAMSGTEGTEGTGDWTGDIPAIGDPVTGVEHDERGRPTGRLRGLDRWLRDRLPREPPPDLAAVGQRLSRLGVTGVTDATPIDRLEDLAPLAEAAASGALPQRTVVTGGPSLAAAELPSPLARGPVKLVIADHALPRLDDLVGWVRTAHEQDRPVAVHCVTRTALALAVAALDAAGAFIGDRIEHGSVVPPELRRLVASLGLVVVTQPNFVAERGDRYLAEVDPDDQPHLYPCRSLLDAGIGVGGGTDAPFGDPDPWLAIRAAVERRTAGGAPLGLREAVSPERALALFLTPPDDPGGEPRRVRPGAPADLCLLDASLSQVLEEPSSERVVLTVHAGVPGQR
ncbi:MAG TPA: amidohydrolase family protein [Acidimicrobiales bacterium]|jgi:predicted amidohydrolase YtcJ|nr:amidohydrolase family protein [Acidimicrobiales bacterium]